MSPAASTISRFCTLTAKDGAPARWRDTDAATHAGMAVDRIRSYLRMLAKDQVVRDHGDGWWSAGDRKSVRRWRAQIAKRGPSYGHSREYRERRELWDRVERQAKGQDRGTLTWQETASCRNVPQVTANDAGGEEMLTATKDPATLSRCEAATSLGISVDTLSRRIKDRTIRAIKIGGLVKIPRSEVDRVLSAAE